MQIAIGIILVLIVLAILISFIAFLVSFWDEIVSGVQFGAFVALIGLVIGYFVSPFGENSHRIGLLIGFILGFMIGFASSIATRKDNKNKQNEKEKTNEHSSSSGKANSSNSSEARIIQCPSCKKNIRIWLPLPGKRGKCVACSSYFLVTVDEYGNLKVERDRNNRSNEKDSTINNYFIILGVKPSATPDEVREAYKKKMQEYHPDRVSGLGEKLRKTAEAESKAINEAYSELKSRGLAS